MSTIAYKFKSKKIYFNFPEDTCYTGDKTRYMGTVSVTSSGRTCQAWASQSPHGHSTNNKAEEFPDGELPSNYCRSPPDDPESRPWCYTTDPDKRWELCEVHQCETHTEGKT